MDWKAPDLATYDPKDVTVKDNSEIGGMMNFANLHDRCKRRERKKEKQRCVGSIRRWIFQRIGNFSVVRVGSEEKRKSSKRNLRINFSSYF